ncbi:MAG: nickel-dependent lactate racemase [Thermotaleaceae bacterium]
MLKNLTMKYGSTSVEIELSDFKGLQVLQSQEMTPIEDVKAAVNAALDHPIGSEPFDKLFFPGDKIVIVVSDVTRLWIRHDLFLPHIVEKLNNLGIADEDIVVLVATGTHRDQSEEERCKIVGQELFSRLRVIDHNCDAPDLVDVGTTSRGTNVNVNRLLTERKSILTGGIVHHLMAGFGGGRKSIVPGVAGRTTIAQNHLHALDPLSEKSNPLIGVGVLENNPLHLDMVESADLVKPTFLFNVVIDTKGNPSKFLAGHWLEAWKEGCQWADKKFGVPIEEKADVVIASCGGFPKDMSLYQSTKTLFNAAMAVKPGGTILLLAECREGAGADEFFSWSKPLKEGCLDSELRAGFTIPGYIFYAAVELAQKANVLMLSSIDPALTAPMGIKSLNSFEAAMKALNLTDTNQKIILMPYGGNTIPIQKL